MLEFVRNKVMQILSKNLVKTKFQKNQINTNMLRILEGPTPNKHGRAVVPHTMSIADIQRSIHGMGHKPAKAHEITPEHAKGTHRLMIATGSTVEHPNHKKEQAFRGFDRNGLESHVLTRHGCIEPDIEILLIY